MAAKRRRRRRGILPSLLTIILALLLYFAYPYIMDYLDLSEDTPPPPEVIPVGEGEYIELHMIDIGQGDSILIRTSGGNVIIDAGPGKSEDELKALLQKGTILYLFLIVPFFYPSSKHFFSCGKSHDFINPYFCFI